MSEPAYLAAVLLPVLWLGCLLAISFLEAPLKFRARGVTREAALAIGQLVFRALAGVELALWLLEGVALWLAGWPAQGLPWFAGLGLVLLVQFGWLLPRLDRRVTATLDGRTLPPARGLHVLYVCGEAAKLLLLPTLCVSLARQLSVSGV